MRKLLLLIALLPIICACSHHDLLESPDGKIKVRTSYRFWNPVDMRIMIDNTLFLFIDNMGLTIEDTNDQFYGNYTFIDTVIYSQGDTTYQLPWGENTTLTNRYNEMLLVGHDDYASTKNIRIRAYNNGVAFRYEYELDTNIYLDSEFDSEHKPPVYYLKGESTVFRFPSDGTCWSIPANFESYEFAYRQQSLSETSDASTPFTFRLKKNKRGYRYGAIHEANLRDFPEMALVRDSIRPNNIAFASWLAPSADSNIGYHIILKENKFVTPWRTISIGRKAVDLINNDMILHLNEPCVLPHPEQYRPMKYIGIWWGMHLGINSWVPDERHGATTTNALRYIDFAAANNIDAVLFEGWNQGWEAWGGSQVFDFIKAAPDFDLDSILAYASNKGVEVIMHHETGGNIPNYESQMEHAYRFCQEHGIHAVKTGYAGGFPNREIHHSMYGVQHYALAMRTAAHYGLALDVHEPIKPTGLRRTYPNLMSAEGARGMEWNAWSDGNSPAHTTILPFTRLLAGPMDYTPGIFDITYERIKNNSDCRKWNQKDARDCRVHTTIAKQAALWVVIYSPLVMAADLIENYEGHPMFQFFREYNPNCSWSHALQGEPGQFIVTARRADDTFYLGAITNEQARNLKVPLDFLPKGRKYLATVYADADNAHFETNPTAYKIYTKNVKSSTKLRLHLASGGGAAVTFSPIK